MLGLSFNCGHSEERILPGLPALRLACGARGDLRGDLGRNSTPTGTQPQTKDRPAVSTVLISNVLFSLSVLPPVYASCG